MTIFVPWVVLILGFHSIHYCTVKLVHDVWKDHIRDQQNVVLIHRWSSCTGSMTCIVCPWEPEKCSLYKQVVFIQVVFRAGLTVHVMRFIVSFSLV